MTKASAPVQGPIPSVNSCSKQKLIFWQNSIESETIGNNKKEEEISFTDFSTKSGSFNSNAAYGLTPETNTGKKNIYSVQFTSY